jgi:hypothetical protein
MKLLSNLDELIPGTKIQFKYDAGVVYESTIKSVNLIVPNLMYPIWTMTNGHQLTFIAQNNGWVRGPQTYIPQVLKLGWYEPIPGAQEVYVEDFHGT